MIQSLVGLIKQRSIIPGFGGSSLCFRSGSVAPAGLLYPRRPGGSQGGSPGPAGNLARAVAPPLALGTSWGMLGRPQLGGFLCLHTHLSVHSFILKGQRLACLNLLPSGAGFGLLWDHPDFLRPGFLGHHSQLDSRVALTEPMGLGLVFFPFLSLNYR